MATEQEPVQPIINVNLGITLATRLDAFCDRTHRNRSEVTRWAIEELLAKQEAEAPHASGR